ncbi:MAG TPA: NAD(P)-dependent oxidoreductase [Acidobacteriaceae bacterium]|nr:NAD(P)-dependent oxidoreductase [Acidobacteriaceae bacterium]
MRIGFLGLGKMGSAMARRLLAAGHSVTVWNRSARAAEALGQEGARVAKSAVDAVRDQDAVITMLFDDAAHEQVLFGDGVIGAIPAGAVHIASSTISVGLSGNLAEEHAKLGQLYVAAPVFGRPNIAADGKLWIVAAGADDAVAKARPVLEAMSRGITVVGPKPMQAHALKLAGNFTITMMLQALSEAAVMGEAYGVDPALLMETLNAALFQSPFYAAYIKLMLNPPEPPGGTMELGQKDLRLFLSAAREEKTRLAVAELMETRFAEAIADGLGQTDWAAGLLKAAERAAGKKKV